MVEITTDETNGHRSTARSDCRLPLATRRECGGASRGSESNGETQRHIVLNPGQFAARKDGKESDAPRAPRDHCGCSEGDNCETDGVHVHLASRRAWPNKPVGLLIARSAQCESLLAIDPEGGSERAADHDLPRRPAPTRVMWLGTRLRWRLDWCSERRQHDGGLREHCSPLAGEGGVCVERLRHVGERTARAGPVTAAAPACVRVATPCGVWFRTRRAARLTCCRVTPMLGASADSSARSCARVRRVAIVGRAPGALSCWRTCRSRERVECDAGLGPEGPGFESRRPDFSRLALEER